MQAETRQIGAAGFPFAPVIFRLSLKSHGRDSLPHAGTSSNSTLHRGAIEFGKQGLLTEQRIRFIRISLWAEAPPLKQSDNPPGNVLHPTFRSFEGVV
jgi:hypothetical protein